MGATSLEQESTEVPIPEGGRSWELEPDALGVGITLWLRALDAECYEAVGRFVRGEA